ncbi:hypothetical protein AW736_15950 [Termitidicoccus mucosus]|uniref:Uncharacterized protein n=1 Tax=Termitidicoccus mucosus TaxID=1184151 RepID=A0A178IG66_9BACT|nr:hypothetical protein AW736_15950 [Opitutaceae bacterium TSB47]
MAKESQVQHPSVTRYFHDRNLSKEKAFQWALPRGKIERAHPRFTRGKKFKAPAKYGHLRNMHPA